MGKSSMPHASDQEGFEKFFASSWEKLGMHLVYDVCHNIAKIETHMVHGKR